MFASVKGTETIRSQPKAFIAAFGRRADGLLRCTAAGKSHHRVTRENGDALAVRAGDWPTAISVGLNEVDIAASTDGRVQFAIRYPRWAGNVLALGAALAIVFIAWAMALFWGFIWPWLLILIHRRPLRRLMKQLIAEVDSAALESVGRP